MFIFFSLINSDTYITTPTDKLAFTCLTQVSFHEALYSINSTIK